MKARPYHILSLDGGGSLGVYTLGLLHELQSLLDQPLHKVFNLVYGTSTGAIIAAMIALGDEVSKIRGRYFDLIPDVMKHKRARQRTQALSKHATEFFGDRKFDAFKIDIGIVTTDLELNRPMIFKRTKEHAHGMKNSFQSGFGCTIATSLIASCSAYPYFLKHRVDVPNRGHKILVDGGFTASNPALFALTDVTQPSSCLKQTQIKMLSLGTGNFPDKKTWCSRVERVDTIATLLRNNATTMDQLRKFLFPEISVIRINGSFTRDDLRTSFLESDTKILGKIFELGRQSFGHNEQDIRNLFC